MGNGSTELKKYKTDRGYFLYKDYNEKLGGKYWFLIKPLQGMYDEKFFYIKTLGNGEYELTGEGYTITSQLSLTDYLKEVQEELSDEKVIFYYFIDNEGSIIKREPYVRWVNSEFIYWIRTVINTQAVSNGNAVSVSDYSKDKKIEYFYPKSFAVNGDKYSWDISKHHTKGRHLTTHYELWFYGRAFKGGAAKIATGQVTMSNLRKGLRKIYEFYGNGKPGIKNKKTVDLIRAMYPKETLVEIIKLEDPYSELKPGDKGFVQFVDDSGNIHIRWRNGESLSAVWGVDSISKVY